MNALITLPWRAYPATLLIALGLTAAVWSAIHGTRLAKSRRDPQRALAIMRGFRISIVGLAVAAIGLAWWWHIGWLFGLAAVIGAEELLESTVVIAALARGPSNSGGSSGAGAGRTSPPQPRAREGRVSRPAQPAAAASQRAMVLSRSGGSGRA